MMPVYLNDGILTGNWLTNLGNSDDEISLMFLGDHVMIMVFGICNPNKPSTNTIKRIVCLETPSKKSLNYLLKNNLNSYHITKVSETRSACRVSPYAPTSSSKMFIWGHLAEGKWITENELVLIFGLTSEAGDQTMDLPYAYQEYWHKCEEVIDNILIYKPGELVHKQTQIKKIQIKLAKFNRSVRTIEYALKRWIRLQKIRKQ